MISKLALVFTMAAAMSIPGSAAVLTWSSVLSSDQEIPSNDSTATGSGWVEYNTLTNSLSLYVEWEGLTGEGLQAHIHCCVADPPGNVGIAIDLWLTADPPEPASGSYSANYDLSVVNPFRAAFTTANGGTTEGALEALIAAMNSGQGRAYYNIHTAQFPGGEIRGNLVPVPEPATFASVLLVTGVMLIRRRLKRR